MMYIFIFEPLNCQLSLSELFGSFLEISLGLDMFLSLSIEFRNWLDYMLLNSCTETTMQSFNI